MKTLNHYRVKITDGGKCGKPESTFTKTVVDVVAENEFCVAINDRRFTSIDKAKSKYWTSLDQKSISIQSNDSYFGSGITYDLYTEKTVRASTIQKQIKDAVNEKLGFFFQGTDLSFIKD